MPRDWNSPGNGCRASCLGGPQCYSGHDGGWKDRSHRPQSLDQKHVGHASAVRGGAGAGLGSGTSAAANQGGDRPSFCKTSLLSRHIRRQQGEGTACHLGSHPLPVVALYPNAPNHSPAWAQGREKGTGRGARSPGKLPPTLKASSLTDCAPGPAQLRI